MEIKPDYYDSFKCIADKCEHNCCIGWEIDIDEETLKKYNNEIGTMKEKLQKNIALEPMAHFILSKNERCPFLNSKNLCELILYGGEDMLCQICSDHPRFYNEIDGITEKGIGLCCEAVARLILTKTETVKLISSDEILQNDFYTVRKQIFDILQNRELFINKRIDSLLEFANVKSPIYNFNWIDVYRNLERLDKEWDKYLDSISDISTEIPLNLEIPCEQLLCYFIYRHLSGALDDFLFSERIQFAVLSCYLIMTLNKTKTLEEMLKIARMYSCEIEYSDENIEILLETLQEYNELRINKA